MKTNLFTRARGLLVLLLLTISIGNVRATSYISYNGTTQDASTTISSTNVSSGAAGKISWTGESCTYSNNRVNIAANGSITFTASTGYNITKIVITSGSTSSYYGTWTSSPSVTPSSSSGTTTFDGLSANSVIVTTSTAFRCTSASSIKIYYTAASSCSDPATALSITSANTATVGTNLSLTTSGGNDETVTWSVTNGTGTATVSGSTLTPTGAGTVTVKATQGENTVSGTTYCGKEVTQTVTISNAPATITLNNYSGSATTTGYYVGDSFTLPSTNSYTCGTKTFVGWSTVEVASTNTKPTSNYYEPGVSVTLGATNTFYAVFATTGTETTATFDPSSITNTPAVSGETLTWKHTASGAILKLSAGSRYTSGTPNTWTVTAGTSNYAQISGVYITKIVATCTTTTYGIGTVSTGTKTNSDAVYTISGINSLEAVKLYATSSQARISNLVVYYKPLSAYSTTCCDDLGQINGPIKLAHENRLKQRI